MQFRSGQVLCEFTVAEDHQELRTCQYGLPAESFEYAVEADQGRPGMLANFHYRDAVTCAQKSCFKHGNQCALVVNAELLSVHDQ